MEKPIVLTTEEVRAILDGRKTQTRQVVKFPKGMTGRIPERRFFADEEPYLYYPASAKPATAKPRTEAEIEKRLMSAKGCRKQQGEQGKQTPQELLKNQTTSN